MDQTKLGLSRHTTIFQFLGYNFALAVIYFAAGGIGLQLAVPPGYATVIWPASGIAIAALLLYGQRLWPGILFGSFILNCLVGSDFALDQVDGKAAIVAASIATGSTIQSLIAAALARRIFGIPIRLSGFRHLGLLALVCGPLSCLLAPTIGIGTLQAAGFLQAEAVEANWLTWWYGDMLGVLVFLPIALFNPWRTWSVHWKGHPATGFSVVALCCVLVLLAVTFYAWRTISLITFDQNQTAFQGLVDDNHDALSSRMNSYRQSLDGGAGLFHASNHVTLNDWRTYVDTLQIEDTLPGINGIGFIAPVREDLLDTYADIVRADGISDMVIHPENAEFANFIIKYIEPIEPNREAVGLNIGFERNRYEAAAHARDSGKSTITKRIYLVQDAAHTPGFLLLRPLYVPGRPLVTVEDRRNAFEGWVYAPFIASRFMADLTSSQGMTLDISVYDGPASDAEQLIFTSRESEDRRAREPLFRVQKTLPVMEQQWTIVWESTPAFETSVSTSEPVLILVGGLMLTALFSAFLLFYARREEIIRKTVDAKTKEIVAREHENRAIVDNAVVAIIVADVDNRILVANRAVEPMFGFAPQELVGEQLSLLLGADYAVGEFSSGEPHGALHDEREQSRGAVRSADRSGNELFLDVQLNGWTTEAGKARYTAIVRDVTEQRKATIALEQTERRWNYALEGSDIGVFDIDLFRNTSIVSSTWKTILGFGADEEIAPQKEWIARVHPEDLPHVMEADRACREGEAERSIAEYRIRRKDDIWVWMRSDAVVVERDENGNATRMIGTQTDITNLKQARDALRASEERFRNAIEHAPVGMIMLTPDRKWIAANDAYCELMGYTKEELFKLDPNSLHHPDEDDIDTILIDELVSGRKERLQFERRYLHKDGHTIWALMSASVAFDVNTQSKYLIGQFHDITAQKEMERLKTDFVATVSHELRTPLTSIRGSLGLLLGPGSDAFSESATRLLSIAYSNCERLVLLINDILDLEKIASGKMDFALKAESIPTIVEQAIEANQGYAAELGVTQQVRGGIPDCYAEVDKGRLHQVLANLLSNAAKFSPRDATVTVSMEACDDRIRINIEDTGPGIPPEFRSKIFTRFSQADGSATRSQSGTGLGLHISKLIVEQMGGTIGFDSVYGEGSTFWIELPRFVETASPLQTFAASAREKGVPWVLHVEDDADICAIIAAYFDEKAVIKSTATVNGARAWLDALPFDLVIIDVGLYNGNGLDLLADTAARGIPAIVLSAQEDFAGDRRVSRYFSKSKVTEAAFVDAAMNILGENGRFISTRDSGAA